MAPERASVEPIGAFVVPQGLIVGRRGKSAVRVVWRRNVLQKFGSGSRPRGSGDAGVRENALGGICASGEVIWLAFRHTVAELLRKLAGPVSSAHRGRDRVSVLVDSPKRARGIGQIAGTVLERRNGDLARIDSLRQSSSLIIGEEKDLIPAERAAQRAPELVLVKCAARGRKVVAGIQVRVAQEFEDIAVECIGTGLGDYADLPSAELAVFRVKVTGEYPELGDGIQVGNDRRAHVDVFFDVASIQHKTVGKFPLAVDRNGARVQTTGGRKCADTHILSRVGCQRRDWSDAGLKGEQVREAAAIERHGSHLFARDDLAHLGIGGFDMRGPFGNGYRLGPFSNGQRHVYYSLAVDIDHDTRAPERLEPGGVYVDVVTSNWQTVECIEALAIGCDGLLHGCDGFRCRDLGAGNRCTAGVCNGSQ